MPKKDSHKRHKIHKKEFHGKIFSRRLESSNVSTVKPIKRISLGGSPSVKSPEPSAVSKSKKLPGLVREL